MDCWIPLHLDSRDKSARIGVLRSRNECRARRVQWQASHVNIWCLHQSANMWFSDCPREHSYEANSKFKNVMATSRNILVLKLHWMEFQKMDLWRTAPWRNFDPGCTESRAMCPNMHLFLDPRIAEPPGPPTPSWMPTATSLNPPPTL